MSHAVSVRVSRAAAEYHSLPAHLKTHLPFSTDAVLLWEAVVTVAAAIADETSGLPLMERLEAALAGRQDLLDARNLELLTEQINAFTQSGEGQGWVNRLTKVDFQDFLERSVGAGAYRRLKAGMLSDITTLASALQLAARAVLPYTLAFHEMYAVVSDKQNSQELAALLDPAGESLVAFVLKLDHALERVAGGALQDESLNEIFANPSDLTTDDLVVLLANLRGLVSDKSLKVANDLGGTVSRKIRGARDALTVSSDGVSQASNSLIELIDRLLREAFSDAEVLVWVDANCADMKHLAYDRDGVRRPTKRGQALCFVSAGLPVSNDARAAVELLADVLVSVRSSLQSLKHADQGTPEELDEVVALMSALEGFFVLGIGAMWRALPVDVVDGVYARINPERRHTEAEDGPAQGIA